MSDRWTTPRPTPIRSMTWYLFQSAMLVRGTSGTAEPFAAAAVVRVIVAP
jgi:hypothetical protein